MRKIAVVGFLVAALVAGCGEVGATEEEVERAEAQAKAEGERIGRYRAEAGFPDRLAQARDNAYWEGSIDGEEEAYELEEEFEEEEREERRNQGGSIGGYELDPTPTKQSGEPSYEFEADDIERAEEGYEDQALREYCEGAVSEAQELGCLSHVDPSEVP